MRYDDTFVELEQDEYVFGSLSKTIEENEDSDMKELENNQENFLLEFNNKTIEKKKKHLFGRKKEVD